MKSLMIGSIVFLGILLIGSSIPLLLGRVAPNQWYGFRTPKTLSNSHIWYTANSGAAKISITVGAVMLLLAGVLIGISRSSELSSEKFVFIGFVFELVPLAGLVIAVLAYASKL